MSQQLVHHLLIIRVDLRDHVTGNETKPGAGLPAVKAICVFVSIDLESQEMSDQSDRLAQPYISPNRGHLLKPHPSPKSVTGLLDP